jgi:hypothetical protein
MKNRQWLDDREVWRTVVRTIAQDLRAVYSLETQLPLRLQAFLQRLDEQQEQGR